MKSITEVEELGVEPVKMDDGPSQQMLLDLVEAVVEDPEEEEETE